MCLFECFELVRTVIVCTRGISCLVLSIFLTITSDFPSCTKQTMGQTKEGHAPVLASLRDTGGKQVSDSVVRRCVFVPSLTPKTSSTSLSQMFGFVLVSHLLAVVCVLNAAAPPHYQYTSSSKTGRKVCSLNS